MSSPAAAASSVTKGRRKPVPKYNPSSPLSPGQNGSNCEDGVVNENLETGQVRDIPPVRCSRFSVPLHEAERHSRQLPDNWKDIIDHAFSQRTPSASRKGSVTNAADENKPVIKVVSGSNSTCNMFKPNHCCLYLEHDS